MRLRRFGHVRQKNGIIFQAARFRQPEIFTGCSESTAKQPETVCNPNRKSPMLCPCESGRPYAQCCLPLHQQTRRAADACELMKSRYAAYVCGQIDYLVETTVPAQRHLLNSQAMTEWSQNAQWLGLTVHRFNANAGKRHAQVEFSAHFAQNGQTHEHRELSAFVQAGGRWYFLDPTVPLPNAKMPCICGSGLKFKSCCAKWLDASTPQKAA